MSFELDSFAVLQAIGSRPEVFADLRRDLAKTAPTLVEKQLKASGADVKRLKAVQAALGATLFSDVIEAFSKAKMTTLLKKLDKHNPAVKAQHSAGWAAEHLRKLAAGEVLPQSAPSNAPKSRKSPRKAKKKPTNAELVATLSTKAMSAKRQDE